MSKLSYEETVDMLAQSHASAWGDKYQWPMKPRWEKYRPHGETTCAAVAKGIETMLDDMGWNELDIKALLIDNGYVPKPE